MICSAHTRGRRSSQKYTDFFGIRARYDDFVSRSDRVRGSEQHTRHRLELAAQTQLAVKLSRAGIRPQLPRGEQNPERDWQIEAAAALGQIRGRQVHGDAASGKCEVGI